MRNILFILFIMTAISGCASNSSFKQNGSDSIFIFKVNPDKKIVFFFKGKEEDGVFKQNVFSKAAFRGKPKNGYVIFKAKPGDTIALTQYAHKSIGFKNSAWPCQGFETITFTVPTNEVLYMTDITLGEKGEIFNLSLNQNFDQASAHMQRHYPRLAPSLKQGTFKLIAGERDCDEDATYIVAADRSTSETFRVPVQKPSSEVEVVPTTIDKPSSEASPITIDKPTPTFILQKHEKTIQNYVAAFNSQDVDSMLPMLADDVQWMSVDGETITKKTNNKEELRKALIDYFDSCSTCRSRLEDIFSADSKVSALEIVSYQTRDGLKEEKLVSVYEFSGSLIKRIYHFPAEK